MISWYMLSTLTSSSPPTAQMRSGFAGPSLEVTPHVVEAFHQPVDVVGSAVDVHRRAGGRRDPVAQAGRSRAVMPDAHGNAALVEQLTDVVRVDALQGERDGAAAVFTGRRADDAQSVDLLQ